MKVDDSMKKMTSSSETSISGIRLISGSSLPLAGLHPHAVRATPPSLSPTCIVAPRESAKVTAIFSISIDDALDLAAQVAVRDVGRNRHREAGRGADQRFGDAARQHARITHAAEHDRIERADDAGHGTEQA